MQKKYFLRYCTVVVFLILGPSLRGMARQVCGRDLVLAAEQGNVAEVEIQAAKIDINCYANGVLDERWVVTPLYAAATNGHTAVVQYLLRLGADPNKPAVDSNGKRTPLCSAAIKGHADIVSRLLDAKADANAPSFTNLTPLHFAAHCKDKGAEIIERLLAAGAEIGAVDIGGDMPLSCAVRSDNVGAVEVLLRAGASAAYINSYGITPLISAIGKNPAIIQALIKAGGLIKLNRAFNFIRHRLRTLEENKPCITDQHRELICENCLKYKKEKERINESFKILRQACMAHAQCPLCLQDADDIKDEKMKTLTPCCCAFICRADLEMLMTRHEPCPLCKRTLNQETFLGL